MKEKNKKVLKGFGVGALALAGMVGLTGCAKIEVSQEKVDSMIETVEKTDVFIDEQTEQMKEQIELLEQQNAMLQEQNTKLEANNTELKQQNTTLQTQNGLITEQNDKLDETNTKLTEQNTKLTEQKSILEASNTSLAEQLEALEEINSILLEQKTTLTSQYELLQSQKTTLETKLAKLEEQVELLKEQNRILEEQNANLEKLLEEAKKMTKEEVWNLAQTADFNLMLNNGGLRDNLIVTAVERNLNLQMDLMYYYNSGDAKIFAELSGDSQGVVTSAELWYQTTDSNVVLADIDKVENEYVCDLIDERDKTSTFDDCIGVYRGGVMGVNLFGLTYDDLTYYEILDNGNVKLTFVKYNEFVNPDKEEEHFIALQDYAFEYSLDGKLVSLKMASRIIEKEGEFENRIGMIEEATYNMEYILRYGEIDTDLVESWVEIAEAKRNEK